ncbi:MAG TPA: DUF1501 domain-containing protein [Candidatus Hydrogenedentes bacterium]|nr:DUF1501 domain-containing protein [Candidatus Hydrogenedentota bacterium]HRK33942.1 DUF1501 domain-containing protein [Candidatus Hydrogenedentota bacterium]
MFTRDPMDPGERGPAIARRWFLQQCGVGLGSVALGQLMGATASARTEPVALQSPHFAPKAKHVIYLFMAGAPSQFELLDYKPELTKFDGTLPPPELLKNYRAAFIDPNSRLLGPRFNFAQHGKSGAWVSELLPHFAKTVDDVAIIKSMSTDAFNHAPAQVLMSTGSQQFGRPSVGSWISYGLGTENKDLPAFVVFSSGQKGPSGGNAVWSSGFLPTVHDGCMFRTTGDPVMYLSNPGGIDSKVQRDTLDVIGELNSRQLDAMGDPEIATRINSFELAFRMQSSAPELMDISNEPQHVLDMYGAEAGVPSFAKNCVLARRMVERGVRFVQLFHEAWDQHGNLRNDLKKNCADTEKACAALVQDLKMRGLLDETIVIWGGEFGRTPMVQGDGDDGRDHHPNAFTIWVAGGGFKPGVTYGESDDLGFNVGRDKVHVRDFHATLLNQLGFNHERFTYKFQGLDARLTGVEPARVVREILA